MLTVSRTGYQLLADPILNKGTAFTEQERDAFALHGLLPPSVAKLDKQVDRRLKAFHGQKDDLARYAFLRELQDTNETLFYALITRNLEEMLPIVYTPTVGLGCQNFSHLYRKPRGLFLSPPHRDRLGQILAHPQFDNISVIVVTDGERILGLGDQGAGGMGIPIGKLSLYTACGGIHPSNTLPVMLDLGTNNKELLADPLYIGWKHERVRGRDYDDFIEAFVSAVRDRWPHVLLQWEDFSGSDAAYLLDRYRDQLCTFNDDIQGTAAVVCGSLLAALAASKQELRNQTIVMLGAGSAGIGITALLARSMVDAGLSEDEARGRFYLLDSHGLLTGDRSDLEPSERPYTQPHDRIAGWNVADPKQIKLEDVVRHAKPSILIGVTGHSGQFTETALREMAKHTERPLVFPLSNPTSRSEATPEDIMAWTDGKAVIGTGSPFPPVNVKGRQVSIDQVNNSYVFPGIGLGVVASRARRVTDAMFLAAARALPEISPSRQDPDNTLLPPVTALRDVAASVARAVALQAHHEGLAQNFDPEQVDRKIQDLMWEPRYVPYRRN